MYTIEYDLTKLIPAILWLFFYEPFSKDLSFYCKYASVGGDIQQFGVFVHVCVYMHVYMCVSDLFVTSL